MIKKTIEAYTPKGRKISSIQTYDWKKDRLLLDNSPGGFIEARIKRYSTADATVVNGAFWLDYPDPDAKYFFLKFKIFLLSDFHETKL